MEAFVTETGKAVVLPRDDIDTDLILPKQFLKNILKTGFGVDLFYDWRYLDDGSPNPDFALNRPENQGATILITGSNFGAGSSREHAVWALTGYGFRAVIAGSFSDIFYMNATKNGLLPIQLPKEQREFLETVRPEERIYIDLPHQTVTLREHSFSFEINPQWKNKFINGEDDIDITMKYEQQITEFEQQRPNYD
ncbi:3-isopropylmalate dehydratase small subunit [Fructilactobacillus hinvesii]|uniref:3-isopropylmalate dehydratase small subunit n=1 Tax=Fructilactobacillus hinvesii TaxID=2940300 RepID=A0ABY5BTR2_9LACO|nr:3-isopropylmalate dehydratase small subunit [Fructilactobacillus hinvesii]USS88523.1 3-isopropylmalate dehydratase small subunit [Fructilactobacillus hinvesii]